MTKWNRLLGLGLAWGLGLLPWAVVASSADGAYPPAAAPVAKAAPVLGARPASVLDLVLPAVQTDELEQMRARRATSRAYLVGFPRELPEARRGDLLAGLPWGRQTDGRPVLYFTLRSPDALALRAQLDLSRLPVGAWRGFYAGSASEPAGQLAVTGDAQLRTEVWSPEVPGDTLGVLILLPAGQDPAGLSLPVPRVSHLVETPHSRAATDAQARALSTSCERDAICQNLAPWSSVRDAVAMINFVSGGSSYQCTATLLSDHEDSTWIPYLYTAHHCVSTAAEAATVVSYWFYERTGCGTGPNRQYATLQGGARLLGTDAAADFALLELTAVPPNGAYYAGWETQSSTGQSVTGIHHPSGDVKKIANGKIDGPASCRGEEGCGFNDMQVTWSQGLTEAGSSGSGLFDSSGRLIGSLWGGSSFCQPVSQQVTGPDLYARFSLALPQVQRYLDATATPLAAPGVVAGQVPLGAWWDYRVQVDEPVRTLEVLLSELAANADLYVRVGAKPTWTSYDCRSVRAGISADYCRLHVAPGNQVYISVYGSQAASFSLGLSVSASPRDFVLIPDGEPRLVEAPTSPSGS